MKEENIKKYFWDVDFKSLKLKNKRIYILKRLLEYGDQKAIKWAWLNFSKQEWNDALKSREVSPATKNFWSALLRLKRK